jgi:hypothetical protein
MSNVALIPDKDEFAILTTICKAAADSKFFTQLGGAAGIMSIALYAREIGVPPMTAIMGGFSNVGGKITMSAELMHSLIRQQGHKLEIRKCDNTGCEIWGKRKDTGAEYVATFTIEDAKRANLIKPSSGWEKHPSDMCFARCISKLKRRLFPDIATKCYVEGELEDITDEVKDNSSKIVEFKPDVSVVPEIDIKTKPAVITEVQVQFLEELVYGKPWRAGILKYLEVKTFAECPASEYDTLVKMIYSKIEIDAKKEAEKEMIEQVQERVKEIETVTEEV